MLDEETMERLFDAAERRSYDLRGAWEAIEDDPDDIEARITFRQMKAELIAIREAERDSRDELIGTIPPTDD